MNGVVRLALALLVGVVALASCDPDPGRTTVFRARRDCEARGTAWRFATWDLDAAFRGGVRGAEHWRCVHLDSIIPDPARREGR